MNYATLILSSDNNLDDIKKTIASFLRQEIKPKRFVIMAHVDGSKENNDDINIIYEYVLKENLDLLKNHDSEMILKVPSEGMYHEQMVDEAFRTSLCEPIMVRYGNGKKGKQKIQFFFCMMSGNTFKDKSFITELNKCHTSNHKAAVYFFDYCYMEGDEEKVQKTSINNITSSVDCFIFSQAFSHWKPENLLNLDKELAGSNLFINKVVTMQKQKNAQMKEDLENFGDDYIAEHYKSKVIHNLKGVSIVLSENYR